MNMENAPIGKSAGPSDAERIFLGLVREGMISFYVGRASQLSEDELRSVFAVAHAAMREAERREVADIPAKPSTPPDTSSEGSQRKKQSRRDDGKPIYPSS